MQTVCRLRDFCKVFTRLKLLEISVTDLQGKRSLKADLDKRVHKRLPINDAKPRQPMSVTLTVVIVDVQNGKIAAEKPYSLYGIVAKASTVPCIQAYAQPRRIDLLDELRHGCYTCQVLFSKGHIFNANQYSVFLAADTKRAKELQIERVRIRGIRFRFAKGH